MFFHHLKRARILSLLAVAPLLMSACNSSSARDTVRINYCYDGDTCTTTIGETLRLACIDTPEIRGNNARPEEARVARDFLRNMVYGKEVEIIRHGFDRYNRSISELKVDGLDIQETMVKEGQARIFWKYSSVCSWPDQYR